MSGDPTHAPRASILVVDDTPNNLRLLSSLLTEQGYKVRSVVNGPMALTACRAAPPDLILLDINMPQMNGYEVCEKLKSDELTAEIPVIFISALDEVIDKVKAFQVGGIDYITKPFQFEEVKVRLETHLTLRTLQKKLRAQNEQLQQEIRERKIAEDKYRSIVENAVEGIFQSNLEGRYLSANPALARLFGYQTPEELIETITDIGQQVYVQPKRREEFIAYMQVFNEVTDFESEVYRQDGSTLWISENARSVKDETGKFLYFEGITIDITERKKAEDELMRERKKSERLLLNVLPQTIAERLKRESHPIAETFSEVSVLFADLVNFTNLSAQIPAKELVSLLNQIFSLFDRLAEHHGLEKIKTIGDAYMAAAGLPHTKMNHAQAVADMALDMQQAIAQFFSPNGEAFQLRIGLNTGPVIAGVIGTKRLTFDLWGDAVNVASRMESQGEPGRIQVTAETYEILQNEYEFEKRGTMFVKGKGEMTTYWLVGRKS